MGPLGFQETIFIFVLALLVFGPKKLPELGKTIGKAMTEFRRASSELRSTWDREMSAVEREAQSLKEVTRDYNNQIQDSAPPYDHSYYDSDPYGESQGSTDPSTVSASAAQGAESTLASSETDGTPPAGSEDPAGTLAQAVDVAVAGDDPARSPDSAEPSVQAVPSAPAEGSEAVRG